MLGAQRRFHANASNATRTHAQVRRLRPTCDVVAPRPLRGDREVVEVANASKSAHRELLNLRMRSTGAAQRKQMFANPSAARWLRHLVSQRVARIHSRRLRQRAIHNRRRLSRVPSIFRAPSQHLWRKQPDFVLRHPSDTNMR